MKHKFTNSKILGSSFCFAFKKTSRKHQTQTTDKSMVHPLDQTAFHPSDAGGRHRCTNRARYVGCLLKQTLET